MERDTTSSTRGSEHVYDALVDAGITVIVGLPGTQTLPIDRTIAEREEIKYVMARHETAIPHIAWGYYESGGGVAATLTVPGPGDTNAAHGLKNALNDGVPIVHISTDSDPDAFGTHPIHEIEPDTFDNVVKENITLSKPHRLREVLARGCEIARTPPYGPVRLGIPSDVLADEIDAPLVSVTPEHTDFDIDAAAEQAATLLSDGRRPIVYVGGGARRSPGGRDAIRRLIDRLNVPVLASFKGQGVFPETDDRFLGVTGGDLPAGARQTLNAAEVVLALGTDFDSLNTDGWSLPMGERLIHVDVDPAELGAVYEPDVGIVGDVSVVCEAILEKLEDLKVAPKWDGAALATAVREEYVDHLRSTGLLDDGPPLSTPGALQTVRVSVPDETVVVTDIGGHRIWSKNAFRAYSPEKFVTAGSWAGMGVGLPGAIGAKLANPDRPVVALSGDGSLFMCAQELHTAAEYGLDVTVVVFNDADYAVISKSPKLKGHVDFRWDSPDWVGLAESYGCQGRRAGTRSTLREALEWAPYADGPTLIDVAIDPNEPTAVDAAAYETDVDPTAF
ncbi:MAG: thiamine pyrophosphate-binding protein [Natronomonas sp.]|nr:thiamine pyrophosphate-binding protein [Natronomonas sp.]